jgi:hypothetical protein
MGLFGFSRKSYAEDPRRQTTGTSYDAKGAVPTEKEALTEYGSQATPAIRDVVPALGSRQAAIKEYDRMVSNDAAVDVSLRAAKTPVSGATYFVEPFDDTPEAMDIAAFVEFNLLRGQTGPFLLVLEEILRMYEYGFSVLEKVFEIREWAPPRQGANRRKYTMLRKLTPRPAVTVSKFNYDDNGGPISMEQNAIRADGKTDKVTIPIEKLIVFTINKKGGNLEGKSLLRTAYKHWYYKDHLYKIDAIQKERHGIGVPDIELPPNANPADKKAAHKMGQNLKTNEFSYIVRPPGWNIGFAKPEGQLVDVMKSIEHHNGMIMLNVLVQFLLLGIQTEGGGGRATSGSHQNMFEKSLKYIANMLCEYINLFLVPQLVAYNYQTDKFPKLSVRNVGEAKDMQMWASAMANLIAQEAITVDIETEQWVREQIDMPAKLGPRPEPTEEGTKSRKGDVEDDRVENNNTGSIGKAADEG